MVTPYKTPSYSNSGYASQNYPTASVYFSGSPSDPHYSDIGYASQNYWDGRRRPVEPVVIETDDGEYIIEDRRGGQDFSQAHQPAPYEAPSMENNFGFASVPDAFRAMSIIPGVNPVANMVRAGFSINNLGAINKARAALGLDAVNPVTGFMNANVGVVATVNIGDQTYTVAMNPNPEDPKQISVNEAVTLSAETLNEITEATPEQTKAREAEMAQLGTTPSAGTVGSAISNIAGTVTGGLIGTDPNRVVTPAERVTPTPSLEAQNRQLAAYNEQFDNPAAPTQVASLDPSNIGIDAGISMASQPSVDGVGLAGTGTVNELGVAERGYQSPMRGVTGRVTSEFGRRDAPTTTMGRGSTMHRGMDFSAAPGAQGQTVSAVNSGTVTHAGPMGKLGNAVQVTHDDGRVSTYGHLSSIGVQPGDQVATGSPIGAVGATGNVSGAHLHFGITDIDGVTAVDPRSVIESFDPGIPTPGIAREQALAESQMVASPEAPGIGNAISPAGFTAMGMGYQYGPQDQTAMAATLAGELSPGTLHGLAIGDPDAYAEAAAVLGTIDNRAMSTTAQKRAENVPGYQGVLSGVLTPDQYNALDSTPNALGYSNLDTTLSNFDQYQQALEDVVSSYTQGLVTSPAPDATHYANLDISNPSWAPSMENAVQVGDHTFGTPDQSWADVQDSYGLAFGPAAAVGIGQESLSGLGMATPSDLDSRMGLDPDSANALGGMTGLAGGFVSNDSLSGLGTSGMIADSDVSASERGATAASTADAADSTSDAAGDSGNSDGGSDGGSSGGDGGGRGEGQSAGGLGGRSGDNDNDGRGT